MQPAAISIILLVVSLFLQVGATAADLARERRVAEQIRDAILDGDPVELNDGAHDFLGILTRSGQPPLRGAALILHGRGANPDWMEVIHPLRTRLPEYGWDTLSIQLPLAPNGAGEAEWRSTLQEAQPRLAAAVRFLLERGIQNIVLIAHSFGNRAAALYLAEQSPAAIQAWVAIGMSAGGGAREDATLEQLGVIHLPVLDLYGENDLDQVMAGAERRRLAARDTENDRYQQRRVAGADHFFSAQDELLVNIVKSWLARVASGSET